MERYGQDMKKIRLDVVGVSKSFAATQALKNVSVTFHPGQVHVLIGENGAGKSTLLKIISGLYSADEGEININGKKGEFSSPKDANLAGISMVYQELTALPDMTAFDNLFLGNEEKNKLGFLKRREMKALYEKTSEKYGISIPIYEPVRNFSIAQQQMFEVLKILMRDPQVVIFDESTSSLANEETKQLFRIINQLKEAGKTIIFISHRMEEIFQIGDCVTVLKDGELIVTKNIDELTQDSLIEYMVGRSITEVFPPHCDSFGEEIFSVEELSFSGKLKNISMNSHKGEIVGIAGLEGQGQTDLLNCLAGVEKIDSGSINYKGKKLRYKNPQQAIQKGIILVPEDRKTQGLFLEHKIENNLCISSQFLRQIFGVVNEKKNKEFTEKIRTELSIKCSSTTEKISNLSGGNQQKVVLGRALGIHPKVLLFNEPTRGIDIRTKQEFYNRMRNLADEGICIIVYSSDLLEIIGISDTVYTIYEGEITSVLRGNNINEVQIMRCATGVERRAQECKV